MSILQDAQEIVWWVALLLQLWDLPTEAWIEEERRKDNDNANQTLSQTTALLGTMRAIGEKSVQSISPLQPQNLLPTLVALLRSTQESGSR